MAERAEPTEPTGAEPGRPEPAEPPVACSSPGWSNVAGIGRIRTRLGGHTIMNARPITWFSPIVPFLSHGSH